MASAAPPPMGGLDYARVAVVFLGAILSIIGGVTPWVVSSSGGSTLAYGLLSTCASGGGAVLCAANKSTGLLAGAALLIIGFIFGIISFVIALSERCCFASCGTPCCGTTRFAFSIIALIATLIGTIIGGVSPVVEGSTEPLSKVLSLLTGATWGPGFGCSIAACLFQAIALALVSMAYCSKPSPAKAVAGQNNYASGYGQATQSPLSRV